MEQRLHSLIVAVEKQPPASTFFCLDLYRRKSLHNNSARSSHPAQKLHTQ